MVSIMTGLKVVSLLITSVSSFEITGVDQNVQNVEPGETARLVCRSSQDWEFCQWSLKYSHQIIKRCTLEWKLVKGGVALQDCSEDLTGRVKIAGEYNNRECGLEITNLTQADSGVWECEMEEYQLGDWSSGKKHQAEMTLNVRPQPSTEHPIFIDRIFSPEGRKLSLLTEAQITTLEADVVVTTATVPTDTDASTPGYSNVTDMTESWNGTTGSVKEIFRAVSSVARDEPPTSEMIIAVCLAVGTLIVFTAVGVIFWRRKYNRSLASRQDDQDHNWIVAEIADMSVATMSDLMTRQAG